MSKCRSCGRSIRWARTAANNRPMPLDLLPAENGNVAIIDGKAHVLGNDEARAMRADGAELLLPHIVSCPNWSSR